MDKFSVVIFCVTLALAGGACTQAPSISNQNSVASASNAANSAATQSSNFPANTNTTQPSSMDYMREGTAAYMAHDFVRAIPFYQRALELEKKEHKLNKKIWLVLVDNLAMAHGMTGDIKGSLSVLEYGIREEPTYPMFYYNMACGYGETGDEDNAIKYLRLAAKYKANMIPGEAFPDPATDNSFRNFADSEKLKKTLTDLSGK